MKKDRISQLPDSLICQIINHLPTKESVKTSVLSTRWRNLWLWVPCLELDSRNFPDFDAFVSFGDRFFDSNRFASLHKLKLTIDGKKKGFGNDVSYLTAWMDAAIKRKIQHLEFSWHGKFHVHTNHLRLYRCQTLVSLKLFGVTFDNAELISFPCMKTLHLRYVSYPNKAAFEKLVSRCPLLEELKIYFNDDDKKGFQVHSHSLRRLILVRKSFETVPRLVIDAPLLKDLSIRDFSTESIIINNLESNAKLCIYLYFGFGLEIFDESRRTNIRKFLSGISRVGDMTTNAETFERIFQFSKVEPLPQFGFMSRLDANLNSSDLKCLPTFLESCPNLKSLILDWVAADIEDEEMNQISFSYVPKCLQSSLKFIYILVPITECAAPMKIVRYLLKNSVVLKKFTLRLAKGNSWTEKYICEDLPNIPRGSSKCEVDVDVW